jgi:hypothetical protein
MASSDIVVHLKSARLICQQSAHNFLLLRLLPFPLNARIDLHRTQISGLLPHAIILKTSDFIFISVDFQWYYSIFFHLTSIKM